MGTNASAAKKCEGTRYNEEQIECIRFLYITFIITWIILIFTLELYNKGSLVLIFCMIPIAVFIYTYLNIEEIDRQIETQVFQINYLTITLLVTLPLFFNLSALSNNIQPLKIVIVGIVFILLAIVDVWIPRTLIPVIQHLKSSLETIGLFLLVIAVLIYYGDIFGYTIF